MAFSCKERSVCPSCSARRAALGAAHLVDHVLPRVAWRQWTLAFPRALRVALMKDEKLLGKVPPCVREVVASVEGESPQGATSRQRREDLF